MKIIKKQKSLQKFLSSLVLLILASNNVSASPLQVQTDSITKTLTPSLQKTSQEIFDPNAKDKAPLIIDFEKMKPLSNFEIIDQKLLTYQLGKQNNVKATYIQGAYAINYTQSW